MLFHILVLLFALPIGATVFKPQTVDQQIKEADGVIIGLFLQSKSVELANGSVATQMIFKMNKEFGMQSDLFGMDEVIIHYPGGKAGEKIVRVDGVPEFVPGEKVALMIKSIQDRYWGLNLGLGTFKVINYGRDTLLINSIFPGDPKVSQIRIEDFEKSVKRIKGSNLKLVLAPDYSPDKAPALVPRKPASDQKPAAREVASEPTAEDDEATKLASRNFSVLWLVVLFSLMGGIFRFVRQVKVK